MIYLRSLIETKKRKTEAVIQAPPIIQQAPAFSGDFIKYIKDAENSIKAGFRDGKWYPYNSVEGGNDTIAYGHKLRTGEDFSNGITDAEADALLLKDINKARDIVIEYHSDWVDKFIEKATVYVQKSSTNAPNYQFFANLNPTNSVFKLSQKQLEMLTDYAFNLGTLKSFPKFAAAVFRSDWEAAGKEYKRTYKDANGKSHPLLGRNVAFFDRYLKSKSSISENITHKSMGLEDMDTYAYELKSEYSYLRYSWDKNTNTFYLRNVGTALEYRNKGYSKELLVKLFEIIKSHNGVLDPKPYTDSGEAYTRHVVEKLAGEFGVRLI